jgi:hypothetical protein
VPRLWEAAFLLTKILFLVCYVNVPSKLGDLPFMESLLYAKHKLGIWMLSNPHDCHIIIPFFEDKLWGSGRSGNLSQFTQEIICRIGVLVEAWLTLELQSLHLSVTLFVQSQAQSPSLSEESGS